MYVWSIPNFTALCFASSQITYLLWLFHSSMDLSLQNKLSPSSRYGFDSHPRISYTFFSSSRSDVHRAHSVC